MDSESKNPFLNKNFEVSTDHQYTNLSNDDIVKYPFKTLNRLVDDIKWCLPYRLMFKSSILNDKPINYSSNLAQLVSNNSIRLEMLILNNNLDYCKNCDVTALNDNNENQMLTTIRGLIILNDKEVNHFRIQVLENNNPCFKPSGNNVASNKYEYHLIPKLVLSSSDLNQIYCGDKSNKSLVVPNCIDEAFFICKQDNLNYHVLRINIFSGEFSDHDLHPITNPSTIKERYLENVQNNSSLSSDVIPNAVHCFKKLINVLKGPILLDSSSPVKTIDLVNTSLTAFLDIDLLLKKLSFKLDNNNLIPPNLDNYPDLKEGFIRKILELIYLGRIINVPDGANDLKNTYSFNDNLSIIYKTFNEVDKHICQTFGKFHNSNELSFFINLSCCTFFQDELIIKCFENSIISDLSNKIFYVDSLKSIINFQQSTTNKGNSKLKTYMENLYKSNEIFGYSDYITHLNNLGVETRHQSRQDLLNIEDDFLISIYESNIKSDPKNYSYFNKSLFIISKIKNSDFLQNFLKNEIIPIDLALNELGVEEITEDDVVITAYEFRMDDLVLQGGNNQGDIDLANKSLISLATNRKSYILMNFIENKKPELLDKFLVAIPPQEAYETLDVNENTNDFELVSKFQTKSLTNDIRILRRALKVINESRNSKIINHFLFSGKIDASLLPAENWPAGLDNIGNTCYLNSLLQYYFSIKPLREMILNFEGSDLESLNQVDRKVGGRKIAADETKRSFQFIYHLQKLFQEMIQTNKRCVEPSKDLAYLSFLPSSQPVNFLPKSSTINSGKESDPIIIDSENESVKDINMSDKVETKEDSESIEEIENPFTTKDENENENDNKSENQSSVTTPEVEDPNGDKDDDKILPISAEEMESTIEIGRQQDVTECIDNVTFQMETALPPSNIEEDGEQYDLIKKLFYGKTKQMITPIDSNKAKARSTIERFSSLIVNISDKPKDIYDALDNYFNEDIVKLEEGMVKKTVTISELPDILQFQVQRVLFDRERLMAYKSIEPIPFSETLYMDRYLDTDDKELLHKKEEVFEWKRSISSLQQERHDILTIDQDSNLNVIDSLITTKKYLESIKDNNDLAVSDDTIGVIENQIQVLKQKIGSIDINLEQLSNNISNQFTNYKTVGYSIFAIFIHRGEASYGHYWIYIKDPHNSNMFRKYNDEIVTEVPDTEVYNFVHTNTATPYYIVYVKDQLEKDYVEPLKRVITC